MKRRELLKGIAVAPLAAIIPPVALNLVPGWKMIARPIDPEYTNWFSKPFTAVLVDGKYRALSKEHRYIAIHSIYDDLDVTDDIEQWLDYLPDIADAPDYYQFSY